MKKGNRTQKLSLNKETVAVLHAPTLQEVNGAATPLVPMTVILSINYCGDLYDYAKKTLA